MDFRTELWSSESYSHLVLILWILIYLMVCTFPILFVIAAAIVSDRRLDSLTNSPNFENEQKLILKHEIVRAELQFDHPLCLSTDAVCVSHLKHESEAGNSETNHKQAISSKDELDSIQNQLNSPKSEQCFKEDDMVRAELQSEDPLCFNTNSVCRTQFRYKYEAGNSETNLKNVISMLDEMAVHSENTSDSCPKALPLESMPGSLKCQDSDSNFYVSLWNFSPRVSWDSNSLADVSSDDDFVGIHQDGLYITLCNDPRTDILEAENDHDMSLHQHKKEEEGNKESSSGIRKDCPPISNSEDSSALKGSLRGNEVELKSRKQKQTNSNPRIGTVLSESILTSSSLSHPQQPTVYAENKEYKNPGNFVLGKMMPKHPDYERLSSRIDSYTSWPTRLKQTPQIMAEAGFFYGGSMDYTRCFHCGGGLRDWEPGDNPWIEHARWYPQCAYVLGKRGQKFVNAVLRKVELLAIQNAQRSESTTRSTIRMPRTATNLESDSSQDSGSQSDHPRYFQNPCENDIAKRLIKEMGFQLERVQEVILEVERKRGQQKITIEHAVELLLADEGRGSRPWRKSNSATMEELNEMRQLFTVNEDYNALPLPTGIPPLTTATKSDQSSGHPHLERTSWSHRRRQNISSPMKSAVNLTLSSPSFGNLGASENTKAAKSPSSSPQLELAALPQLDEKSLRKEYTLLRDQNICRICKERNGELRVLPCGHLMCCEVCVQDLRFCPVCHASVKTELWK